MKEISFFVKEISLPKKFSKAFQTQKLLIALYHSPCNWRVMAILIWEGEGEGQGEGGREEE